MKNIKKFLQYAEHDLPAEERLRFEEELHASPGLREEYESFLRLRESLAALNPSSSDETLYWSTTVARMRAGIEPAAHRSPLRFAVSSFSAAVLMISLIVLFGRVTIPTQTNGLLSEKDREEIESLLAGSETETARLSSSLTPGLTAETTVLDEEEYAELESELANSIARTEEERIEMLTELASSDDLISSLSDDEVDDLLLALTNENE